jgi:hypothetical protein
MGGRAFLFANAGCSFAAEVSMSLEYRVMKDGVRLQLAGTNFTAPRKDGVVVSVAAELQVR